MNHKQEIEEIRGESISLLGVETNAIPCHETSDEDLLCHNPLVSVCMTVYNHANYLHEAIQGVLNQKTDFEFELVIGEDCSTDDSRAICQEYQKKYPDRVRVLWSEQNQYASYGNERRVLDRCRGKYIAICEGDDYWIDSLKLMKQVSALEGNPQVALCFSDVKVLFEGNGKSFTDGQHTPYVGGVIRREQFLKTYLLGQSKNGLLYVDASLVRTPTTMFRADLLRNAFIRFDIFKWRFYLTDVVRVLGAAMVGDVYYLPEVTAVYRVNDFGVTHSANCWRVWRDAWVTRLYYARESLILDSEAALVERIFWSRYARLVILPRRDLIHELKQMLKVAAFKACVKKYHLNEECLISKCVFIPLPIVRIMIRIKRRVFR